MSAAVSHAISSKPARPRDAAPRRRRIVAVLRPGALHSSLRALARARAVAGDDAALEVLVVRETARTGFRSGGDAWPIARLFGLLEALRERVIGHVPRAEIVVRTGELLHVVRQSLERSRPALVVVGEDAEHGGRWAKVTAETGAPILVARRSRKSRVIVAATDASDPTFPTLTQASRFTGGGGQVDLLHNLDALRAAEPTALRRMRALWDARASFIHRVAREPSPAAQVVLTTNRNAMSAVVEHSDRRDADIVVVGVHRHPNARRTSTPTASALVEGLDRSILVVPVVPIVSARSGPASPGDGCRGS